MTNLSKLVTDLEQGLLTSRQKKISADSIVKVLENLEDPNCSVSWCSANWINNGKGLTHVLLAVRLNGHVFIGNAEGSVQRSSPGRAWADLKPWNVCTSTIKNKLIKWTAGTKINLKIKDLKSFCEKLKTTKLNKCKEYEINKNLVVKEKIKI